MTLLRSDLRCAGARRWPGPTATSPAIWVLGAAAALITDVGRAESWTTQAAVRADVTATTNGNSGPSGEERKDLITSIRPTFQVSGTGARLRANALIGADLVSYARNSEPDQVSPRVLADLNATLAEKLLFLDASADVRQAELDPFASRANAGGSSNYRVTSNYRISPYVDYEMTPESKLLARYEEVLARTDADDLTNQRFSKVQVRAEHRPVPLGGALELTKQEVRFAGNADGGWTLESVKARGDVAIGGEWVVGPIVGRERTTLSLEEVAETLYGAHLQWEPNQRTRLTAEVEHRFFGTGWDVSLRHRTPLMSFALAWSRLPVTSTTSLGVAPAGTNLSAFLNSILTTRYPDPVARGALVNNLIASRGLPNELPGAIDIVSDYAQLQTRLSATCVLLGVRDTVSLTAYQQTLDQLTRSGTPIGSAPNPNADNRQTGVTLNLNRKLTPQMSVDLTSTWSRIRGLADRAGDETEEQSYRLALTRALSPRTGASAGLQYRKLDTTVVGIDSFAATEGFVGLEHRF